MMGGRGGVDGGMGGVGEWGSGGGSMAGAGRWGDSREQEGW